MVRTFYLRILLFFLRFHSLFLLIGLISLFFARVLLFLARSRFKLVDFLYFFGVGNFPFARSCKIVTLPDLIFFHFQSFFETDIFPRLSFFFLRFINLISLWCLQILSILRFSRTGSEGRQFFTLDLIFFW